MTNASAIPAIPASRTLASPLSVPVLMAVLFLIAQMVSAIWIVKDFEPPNASGLIARNLATTGNFACEICGTRLFGRRSPVDKTVRMFQLPGEPLYLAACFRYVPASLLRFVQLPFNALLIFALVFVAQKLAGSMVAMLAGVIALVEPFIIIHGPVWDDTFTGAALVWAIFALLLAKLGGSPQSLWRLALIALLAAAAALMRTSAQLVLVLAAMAGLSLRPLRPIRLEALTALAAVFLALSAWGYRNYQVTGHFSIGDTHSGISLWESVYPSAREALMTRGQTEVLNNERMQGDFAKTAFLGEVDANRYFEHRAVTYILSHPADVAWTAAVKTSVGLVGLKTTESFWSRRNVVAWLSNLVLLVTAAFGVRALPLRHGSPQRVLWLCLTGSLLLVQVVFMALGPVGVRYRIDFEPVLWILAASCLVQWARRTPLTI